MHCLDVTERLLAPEPAARDVDVEQHVAGCTACASVARGLQKLDGVLRSTILVIPPLDLQRQLQLLVQERAAPTQSWREWLGAWAQTNWMPRRLAIQSLGALMLTLSSWQAFGFVSSFRPIVGDTAYAMQLVAASPASSYLTGLQIDLQSLGVWSIVGLIGWLVAEDGILSRQLSTFRRRVS